MILLISALINVVSEITFDFRYVFYDFLSVSKMYGQTIILVL